jgi:L-lactate dehydrogenase complex protein LldG
MSNSSRDKILGRLRAVPPPFANVPPITERKMMVPMEGESLVDTFVQRAKLLSANVLQPDSGEEALEAILQIIGEDKSVLSWDFARIPLAGLSTALQARGITVADSRDESVRVGITGVDAALAATGSFVVSAREGRDRSVSLLPYVHIVVLREAQILPHLEAWLASCADNPEAFRAIGNHVVITGPSRTADIAMELVLGAHGPAAMHILVMK